MQLKMLKVVVRLHKHSVSVGLMAPTVGDFKRVIFISDWGNFPLRLSEKNERKAEKERKREKNPLCKCKSVISGEVRWCPMLAGCWRISLSLVCAHTRAHRALSVLCRRCAWSLSTNIYAKVYGWPQLSPVSYYHLSTSREMSQKLKISRGHT